VIKHIADTRTVIVEREGFRFFLSKNRPGYIPADTIRYLKKTKPDIVLVQGLRFPLHVIRLRMILGRKVKILVKHHADKPPGSFLKKIIQQFADRCINAYLFTSFGNAAEWIAAGIIKDKHKLYEFPATLTGFLKQDKEQGRQQLGMDSGLHYLWVGKLDANKDPLTVIHAFAKYLAAHPSAKLHMIFQSAELLGEIKKVITEKGIGNNEILLHGSIPNQELPVWYSAADFFISASHREAGSAAVLEAMSCGCIPIVTKIPSSLKVTENGKYSFCFEAGNVNALMDILTRSAGIERTSFSKKIELYFQQEYSATAMAGKLLVLCETFTGK
jgi:glycosyltransferase involved in cell wall biosynthesis